MSWVFSAGGGRGSVEACCIVALKSEESLSGIVDSDVHFIVADVVKSSDIVDRCVLDCVLRSLGLSAWFRCVYFSDHAFVRVRFQLGCGLGELWTWDEGIPQGCLLNMILIVALFFCIGVTVCNSLDGVQPQLYAGNLICVTQDLEDLLRAAMFTIRNVRPAGQEPAPSKCVTQYPSGYRVRNKEFCHLG